MSPPRHRVKRLEWSDEALGSIPMPRRPMIIKASFGSGLTRREQDPAGIVWAIGDRGPNLKIKTMVERFGAGWLKPLTEKSGAKVMPRLDLGPRIAQLRVSEDRVELVSSLCLTDREGEPVSGLPVPGGEHALSEPALDVEGHELSPDPSGLDTEGIASLPGGGFIVGDEFGPSLVELDAGGRILKRIVPGNVVLEGAHYPVERLLPPIASKRQLNRGFEAIAMSEDGKWLFLAFQSPLAHPDEASHKSARHVRLWRLDAATFELVDQYLYALDPPGSFARDTREGSLDWSDLKLSELTMVGGDVLLVLERGSETTKIYRVDLSDAQSMATEHLDIDTRPTIEEISAAGEELPCVAKQLIFTTDDAPEVAADLEGMAILSATELLLVNDNDFGVEGAETSFWKISFEEPVLG
jgi:hypothetical protein